MVFEEYKTLNDLSVQFIKLSPEFPEEKSLALQIGTSLGKLYGLIQDPIDKDFFDSDKEKITMEWYEGDRFNRDEIFKSDFKKFKEYLISTNHARDIKI
jgi:hypothetical protein